MIIQKNIKLIDGYHIQLVYVKKLLQQDFNNAIVLVNTAISWIEYAVAAKFELVENKHGHSLTRKIKNSLMISINTVKKIQKRCIL